MNEMKKAVVSVLGADQKGIIARVTKILYEHEVNILDISQTITSGLFNMIMVADITGKDADFDALSCELDSLGERLNIQIRIQRCEIFDAMHHV